jgi:prepilin-type N-terminal cleavage/methylation domain-containing protein
MKNPKGFTMIEIIVAISILVLVFILGSEFIIRGFKSFTYNSEEETAVQNARKIMETVSKDVRECTNSERGDYPIAEIGDQSFTFYGDTDNDGTAEKVHYLLDGYKFEEEVTDAGPAKDYSGPVATTTIADFVNNQTAPIFYYFDSNNATTTLINNVRLVKINLKINVTPWRVPDDYELESYIELRNLKDNL